MVFLIYVKKSELAHLGEGVAFPWIFLVWRPDICVIMWICRFSQKRSSRVKMNLYNVYMGGLNPANGFAISPPLYMLWEFIFGRLLLFRRNRKKDTIRIY